MCTPSVTDGAGYYSREDDADILSRHCGNTRSWKSLQMVAFQVGHDQMIKTDNRESPTYSNSVDVAPLDYAGLKSHRDQRIHTWHYWLIFAHFMFFFLLGAIKLLWFSELRNWSPHVARTALLPWWNAASFYWHDHEVSLYLAILIDAITLVIFMVWKHNREGCNHRLIVSCYAVAQVATAAVGFWSYRVLTWGSSIVYVNQAGTVVSEVTYNWDYTTPMLMACAISGAAVVIVSAALVHTIQDSRQRPMA